MQRPFLPAAIVFLLVWGCAPALVENPASAPRSTDAPSEIAKTTPQVYARTIGVPMDDGRICIWEATEQSASTMRNAFRIVEDIR